MTGGYQPDLLRSRLSAIRLGRVFRVIYRDRRSTRLGAVPIPSRSNNPGGTLCRVENVPAPANFRIALRPSASYTASRK